MLGWLTRYARWLHTQWPAGTVEKLPLIHDAGSTNVPGLYVAGDLTGIPLLKFASDTGARAVQRIVSDPSWPKRLREAAGARPVLDLVIIGAGVSGMAAALEARKAGLTFAIIEASEPFFTLVNFPRGKPIFTYPTQMAPAGDLQFSSRSAIKEGLLEELREITIGRGIRPRVARADSVQRAHGVLETHLAGGAKLVSHRVIVAIGRTGDFHRLGTPGEELDKVFNRLHDPKDHADRDVLVVGGGDSALEAAIAMAQSGARVTLCHRKPAFSRPRPGNIKMMQMVQASRPGSLSLAMDSQVRQIRPAEVTLAHADGREEKIPNDAVFTMIGRKAPLEFFRRSGVKIRGEWSLTRAAGFAAFVVFCVFLYNWKAGGRLDEMFKQHDWFPFQIPAALAGLGGAAGRWFGDPSHLLGTLGLSLGSPGFYYSLAYSLCVVVFGIRRIRKSATPYIRLQTATLMAVQVVPLFLLPYIILPWAGHNGWFDAGALRWLADHLFPLTAWDPQGREYWRAFGLILAWPLFIWNVFSPQPMWLWLAISIAQTFVVIPLLIYFWGKGAYCGWICSCGALAETLGDAHRHKMPHGPFWNRLNMVGQGVLAAACVLLGLRIASWIAPGSLAATIFSGLLNSWGLGIGSWRIQINYYWWVDVMLAGIIGTGCYFWLSGRVWCRFACPLAALMHLYARLSRFRILPEKSKCISCNICTLVCHQGIDVMSFANRGLPMADPQCVRCSACVLSCPTGTLAFGQVNAHTLEVIGRDRLAASSVLMAEGAAKEST
jgi:thioredoxin reductase/ferredoxin